MKWQLFPFVLLAKFGSNNATQSTSLCTQFNPIKFPSTIDAKVGRQCVHFSGNPGTCQKLSKCDDVLRSLQSREVAFQKVICKNSIENPPFVCCKQEDAVLDISKPKGILACGEQLEPIISEDLRKIYVGNQTAEHYKLNGYTICIRKMFFDDIAAFEYNKGSDTGIWDRRNLMNSVPQPERAGINARRVFTSYMALLGNENEWLCDGVLVHKQWVLTAAHCFNGGLRISDIVRLGEYDFSDDIYYENEFPLDFKIEEIQIYPRYKFPSVSHDLALVKISKPIPILRHDIGPICLPWGKDSSTNLIGTEVTLTGWGAEFFLGPRNHILQEVNVTVFHPSVCDRSYSRLADYRSKFPGGITEETALCAGDEGERGRDACQGDSGGPIAYLNKEGKLTLAGIVSTGNGCGLKEFPGIYVPIHNPNYLSWIKKIAFQS